MCARLVLEDYLSALDFQHRYMNPNRPGVFAQWITNDWPARQEFSLSCGGIAIDHILNNSPEEEFGSHPTISMTLEKYREYWRNFKRGSDNRLLYLKDWHYFQGCKNAHLYTVPSLFRCDWLNEFWDFRLDVKSDYRFCYVGPGGTWTPLHVDVFRSFSWSANIVGHKRWWLFPPGQERHLINKSGQLPHDIRTVDLDSCGVDYYIFDQGPGEAIFVPSDWYHQVVNVIVPYDHPQPDLVGSQFFAGRDGSGSEPTSVDETDCVSINHNWLNSSNADRVWAHLEDQLRQIEESTKDVADTPGWVEECQTCLRALAGMNFFDFFVLLKFIFLKRLTSLEKAKTDRLPSMENFYREYNQSPDKSLDILSDLLDQYLIEYTKHLSGLIASIQCDPTQWKEMISSDVQADLSHPQWIPLQDISSVLRILAKMLRHPAVIHLKFTEGIMPELLVALNCKSVAK